MSQQLNPIKWYHSLGLSIMDKLILGFVLFITALDVSVGFSQIGYNLFTTLIIVFILYMICWVIGNLPGWFIWNKGKWVNGILGFIATLLIILLFPVLLEYTFMFTNFFGFTDFHPTLSLKTILFIAFIFRAVARYFITRHIKKGGAK